MIKVNNKKIISSLSRKSLKSNRTRNIIAIAAIALTTVLFTSLFTIALSFNEAFQQANFRQVGGYSHGSFKYMDKGQFEELKADPLIKEYGLRRFVGMPQDVPFNKAHVEIGYSDAKQAEWMYINPVEGCLPREGTNEAATDTRVLSLLGIKPEIGAEFTMTFDVDGQKTTESFILSGWWKYDEAIFANHVLIPESRLEKIFAELKTQGNDGMTGTWNMDVMFKSSLHIARDIFTVLANHGYQSESKAEGRFIAVGINWGYSGSQLYASIDPVTVLSVASIFLLIIFTGYLIIYNIFQISVAGDIRFYGLLKTIGTTGRQIKRIIRNQAIFLSAVGIPLGLAAGYAVGIKLTPVVLSRLNGVVADTVSASPVIFACSSVFSLVTVLISCLRPGRRAACVSPVEAVRYTEGSSSRRSVRKAQKGADLFKMAWANLGRSRSKTLITIISLSLAVVLLNMTVTFTNGFSMDKYLRKMVADFIVGDAGYFQTGTGLFSSDRAVSEEVIEEIHRVGGVEDGGRIYGMTKAVNEFIDEEHLRRILGRWSSEDELRELINNSQRSDDGKLAADAQLLGMEEYILNKLSVLEGDASKLHEAGNRYIAAVCDVDDYGNARLDSHWAKVGDKITLRYIDEYEYYDPDTGEILDFGSIDDSQPFRTRAVKYRDVEYEVAALVTVPHALGYRYYGSDRFVMNDKTFIQDTETSDILQYSFDTTDEGNDGMEVFLKDFTNSSRPEYDYESKQTYVESFEDFRNMYLMLGSILSFIVGLVGVLNFFNAVMTGILSRRREFAVLQAVGMTGRQLKSMLVYEGLCYSLGAAAVSLLFSIAAGPLLSSALGRIFWFFSYRLTLLPVLCMAPVFAILGIVLPLIIYNFVARHTIVERLRDIE